MEVTALPEMKMGIRGRIPGRMDELAAVPVTCLLLFHKCQTSVITITRIEQISRIIHAIRLIRVIRDFGERGDGFSDGERLLRKDWWSAVVSENM